eukprot:7038338-Prymnesium_polylepis.1
MEHVYNDRREATTKPTALAVDPVQPPAYYSDSAKSMNDLSARRIKAKCSLLCARGPANESRSGVARPIT